MEYTSFYQYDYDRCIQKGYKPLVNIVGEVTKDENIDKILDIFDMYCDIQELLIYHGYKKENQLK